MTVGLSGVLKPQEAPYTTAFLGLTVFCILFSSRLWNFPNQWIQTKVLERQIPWITRCRTTRKRCYTTCCYLKWHGKPGYFWPSPLVVWQLPHKQIPKSGRGRYLLRLAHRYVRSASRLQTRTATFRCICKWYPWLHSIRLCNCSLRRWLQTITA